MNRQHIGIAAQSLTLMLAAAICCCTVAGCASGQGPSTAARQGSQSFDVFRATAGTNEVWIGRVAADADFQLRVLSATADQKTFLSATVHRMNEKPAVHADIAPPPGSQQFYDYSRLVPRGSPEFPGEFQTYLKKYYDLVLRPVSK
jgi:hypothetical protein